jgi:glucose/arabinose dehydrogenase
MRRIQDCSPSGVAAQLYATWRRPVVGLVVLALALVGLTATAPRASAAVPGGFTVLTLPSGQAALDATDARPLPGGGFLTTGKSGKLAYVGPGGSPVRTLATVPTTATGDIGLIGVDIAANWSQTGDLYLVAPYVASDGIRYNRVTRWQVNNPSDPTSASQQQVVLDRIRQQQDVHGAGTVLVRPNGTICAGFGDESSHLGVQAGSLRALDVNDPHGKILCFLPNGAGDPANPFYDPANPTSWKSRVFAMGMRNPFRFTLDTRTGGLVIGDVGWNSYEEQDYARGGENFGWPCYEGSARTPGHQDTARCKSYYASGERYDPPFYSVSRNAGGVSTTGGIFYKGTSYPAAYRGAYFFGDYGRQTLSSVQLRTDGSPASAVTQFGTSVGGPVDFFAMPNADIGYVEILSGTLKVLRYAGGNQPPTANATFTTDPGTRTVRFDARTSQDPDGDALTYAWAFGDGATATGATPSHVYPGTGPYSATLTVRDAQGATATKSLQVHPANATPTLTLTTPPAGSAFAVGQDFTVGATATDREDGPLTVSWVRVLQHCPSGGACHAHPDGQFTGSSLTTTFSDHGGDTKVEIRARVVDSTGAVNEKSYFALPDLRTLTVSSPRQVTVDGLPVSSVRAVAGQQLAVTTAASGACLDFASWQDGGTSPSRTVTMPRADVSLAARYTSEIDAKYAALGGTGSVLGAPTGPEHEMTGTLAPGRRRPYTNGAVIMCSDATGAHEVHGVIGRAYTGLRVFQFGYPTTDEIAVTGGRASYFQNGRYYWSASTGAHEVHGNNLAKYLQFNGPTGFGLPTTDEMPTPDGVGRFNHFTGGRSIYWTPATNSHAVYGAIRTRWQALGWERSRLRYPTTDEYAVPNGRRNDFQGGSITYSFTTRATTVVYR